MVEWNKDPIRIKWKKDPVKFFKDITKGFFEDRPDPPEPHEIIFLESLADPNETHDIVSAGRGGFKTCLLAIALLWFVVCMDYDCLIFSGTVGQTEYEIRYLLALIRRNPILEARVKGKLPLPTTRQIFKIFFKHSSDPEKVVEISVLPEDRLHGAHVHVVVCDEACDSKNENIRASHGCLRPGNFKFILASTPHDEGPDREKARFIEILDDPKKAGYKLYQWSLRDLMHWKGMPKRIKDLENENSVKAQAYEIDGKVGLGLSGYLFKRTLVNKIRDDTLLPSGSDNLFLSIDWNQGGESDMASPTVVMLWELDQDLLKRLGVWEFKGEDLDEQCSKISDIFNYPYENCPGIPKELSSPGSCSEIIADSNPPMTNQKLRKVLSLPKIEGRKQNDPYQEILMRDKRRLAESFLIKRMSDEKIKVYIRGTTEAALLQRKVLLQLDEYQDDQEWLHKKHHFHDHADCMLLASYLCKEKKEGSINPRFIDKKVKEEIDILRRLQKPKEEDLNILKLLSKDYRTLTNEEKWNLWNSERTLKHLYEVKNQGNNMVEDPNGTLVKLEDAIAMLRSTLGKKKELLKPLRE